MVDPTCKGLADVMEVPPNRLYQLLSGTRNTLANTSLRLRRHVGLSADFWMCQSAHELDLGRRWLGSKRPAGRPARPGGR